MHIAARRGFDFIVAELLDRHSTATTLDKVSGNALPEVIILFSVAARHVSHTRVTGSCMTSLTCNLSILNFN